MIVSVERLATTQSARPESGRHQNVRAETREWGEVKQSYVDMAEAEGLPLSSFIQDEVNAPKEEANG